jgi:hypothetical protein
MVGGGWAKLVCLTPARGDGCGTAAAGALTITASFEVESATRVAITYEKSTLEPDQLQSLFEKNYDVLLAVFNPEGWLDVTYVDADTRVGRDDKGNIFVTERI